MTHTTGSIPEQASLYEARRKRVFEAARKEISEAVEEIRGRMAGSDCAFTDGATINRDLYKLLEKHAELWSEAKDQLHQALGIPEDQVKLGISTSNLFCIFVHY